MASLQPRGQSDTDGSGDGMSSAVPASSSDPLTSFTNAGDSVSHSEETGASDATSSITSRRRGKGRGGTGRFKHSWKLPPYITASKRGTKYAYCKLCSSNFDLSHGGFNDIKRHVEGVRHADRLSQSSSSSPITSFYGMQAVTQSHAKNVTSAEVMMCQFLAMHNLPFLAADHLSDLFRVMFPDSKIAGDFACKRTKTKSIICGALDPHFKEYYELTLPQFLFVLNAFAIVLICDIVHTDGFFMGWQHCECDTHIHTGTDRQTGTASQTDTD